MDISTQAGKQTIFIEEKLYRHVGVSSNGGPVQQVSVAGMGKGVIGIMHVYDKIPKGRKKAEFTEAQIDGP